MAKQRYGGLRADPDTEQFKAEAAVNRAALSKKERADLQRVRISYDAPKWLKEAIERAAKEEGTSHSQMGAFLLAWGFGLYQQGDEELLSALRDGKQPSPSLRLSWNITIPRELERTIVNGAD